MQTISSVYVIYLSGIEEHYSVCVCVRVRACMRACVCKCAYVLYMCVYVCV